jgi:hypothetical protein
VFFRRTAELCEGVEVAGTTSFELPWAPARAEIPALAEAAVVLDDQRTIREAERERRGALRVVGVLDQLVNERAAAPKVRERRRDRLEVIPPAIDRLVEDLCAPAAALHRG